MLTLGLEKELSSASRLPSVAARLADSLPLPGPADDLSGDPPGPVPKGTKQLGSPLQASKIPKRAESINGKKKNSEAVWWRPLDDNDAGNINVWN